MWNIQTECRELLSKKWFFIILFFFSMGTCKQKLFLHFCFFVLPFSISYYYALVNFDSAQKKPTQLKSSKNTRKNWIYIALQLCWCSEHNVSIKDKYRSLCQFSMERRILHMMLSKQMNKVYLTPVHLDGLVTRGKRKPNSLFESDKCQFSFYFWRYFSRGFMPKAIFSILMLKEVELNVKPK